MDIQIINRDIAEVKADLIVLKHAAAFHGADAKIASLVGFSGQLDKGDFLFVDTDKLKAPEVLFIEVGALPDFRYEQIQAFGSTLIRLVRNHSKFIKRVALTIHGPGYGLDPREAFLSLMAGIIREWVRGRPLSTQS